MCLMGEGKENGKKFHYFQNDVLVRLEMNHLELGHWSVVCILMMASFFNLIHISLSLTTESGTVCVICSLHTSCKVQIFKIFIK